MVDVVADLDRVRARPDGRVVAAHARVWAHGLMVSDPAPAHVATTQLLREQVRQPATASAIDDLSRDPADYRAFGLLDDGQVT